MGFTALKSSKFGILPIRGESFARFLRTFHHLFAFVLVFFFNLVVFGNSAERQPSYNHLPSMGKFLIPPGGETTDRIKNSKVVQKWDGPPLSP